METRGNYSQHIKMTFAQFLFRLTYWRRKHLLELTDYIENHVVYDGIMISPSWIQSTRLITPWLTASWLDTYFIHYLNIVN